MLETGAVFDTAPLVFYLSGVEKPFGRELRRFLRRAEAGRSRIAVPTVCLFVRADNAPAIRLYESIGMRRALFYRSLIF